MTAVSDPFATPQPAQSPWASQVVAWGHPAAPPPPGPIRVRWIVLGVVAGVALIGLVGSLGVVAAWRRSATPEVASASAHQGPLRDYMVPAPAGSRPWSSVASEQDLDLTAASQLVAAAEVGGRRGMLSHRGFVRGYVRRWHIRAMTVQVVLYQFKDDAGAAGFASDDLTASVHDDLSSGSSGDWAAPAPIDGTENGISMVLNRPYPSGDVATLGVAPVKDVVVTVVAAEPPPANVQLSDEIVVAQVQRL